MYYSGINVMTLSTEDRFAIIDYRLERAHKALAEAQFVADGGFWNLAANRLYYAVFYACEALLLKHNIGAQSHGGVSRMINLNFVKSGILSTDDKNLLAKLFRMRQTGDYEDLSDWTEEEIYPMIPKTERIIAKIEGLIRE